MSQSSPPILDLSPNKSASQGFDLLVFILRVATFLCFAGWTWVHYYWEGPYTVLVWNESTFALAEKWGIEWEEIVGSGANDGWVQTWLARIFWIYLLFCAVTLTVKKESWMQKGILLLGSVFLMVLMYAKYLKSQEQIPMFVEHGGQMLIPVVLVLALSFGARHALTVSVAVIAFITTFVGHGCYALGLWPTPATFFGMTSVITGLDYDMAKLFLRVAGILDFAVCLGIFIPSMRRVCTMYAALWGLFTAMARPVAGMSFSLIYWGADQFLHEFILRAPHFLIPLFLFLLWKKEKTST